MSRIFLETERLVLRQFQVGEANLLLELDSDPDVRHYLLMPDAPNREDAERTLTHFLDWYAKCPHYGFWAVEEKPNGNFVGWFHFRPSRDNADEIEIGYRLKKDYWGKGYATELTKVYIAKAFEEWGVEKVVASADIEHQASLRVMQKAGMYHEMDFLYDGQYPSAQYALTRAEYLSNPRPYG